MLCLNEKETSGCKTKPPKEKRGGAFGSGHRAAVHLRGSRRARCLWRGPGPGVLCEGAEHLAVHRTCWTSVFPRVSGPQTGRSHTGHWGLVT